MEYVIKGRHKDNLDSETLDLCNEDEKDYLVNEYQISFGNDWDIWTEKNYFDND